MAVRLEGVSGVDPHPAGAAVDGLGHVVGPLVGQLVGVHLDGLRGSWRRSRSGTGGPARRLARLRVGAAAAGGHGADLGELPVALGLHGVGGFPFGRDMGLVLRQLVGGGVAPSAAARVRISSAAVRAVARCSRELVEQGRHGATSSISHLGSRDARDGTTWGDGSHSGLLGELVFHRPEGLPLTRRLGDPGAALDDESTSRRIGRRRSSRCRGSARGPWRRRPPAALRRRPH